MIDVILPIAIKLILVILISLMVGLLITHIKRRNKVINEPDEDKVLLVFPHWYPKMASVLIFIACLLLLLVTVDVIKTSLIPLFFAANFFIPGLFILWSYYGHKGYFTHEGIVYKAGLKIEFFYPWAELESVQMAGKKYRLAFYSGKILKLHRLMLGVDILLSKAESVIAKNESERG